MGYVASMALGTVGGMALGQSLDAIPTPSSGTFPATSGSARAKATADGTPVNPNVTPRQHLFMSAFIVVLAMVILLGGSRFLRDARIS